MLGDALSYPRNHDDWLKTVLIGGVLTLLSFLVIPAFLVQGYMVRVLRSAATDENQPPVFDDWGDLLVDGLKAIVIAFVYVGVPAVVLTVGLAVLGAGATIGGNAGAGFGLAALLFGLVMVVVTLVAAYAVPAALTNFATTDSFGAAFEVRDVIDVVLTSDYLVAWVLAVVVGVVLGGIAALLQVVLVGVFLTFYVNVAIFYLFGRGYAKGRGARGTGGATAAV